MCPIIKICFVNLYFVEKFSEGDTDRQLVAMRKLFTLTDLENCEAIYCASIVKMNNAMAAKLESGKPLVVYCWDYYSWAHNGKHPGYDWLQYAQFLKQADLVLVPSSSQQLRLKELLGIDSTVVHTGIPTYDMPISDERFILDPVRYYPEENRTWAEEAAHELGIPVIHSEHQYSEPEFQKLVASCSFLTCAYREASTGGLSLMEGLYLGKASLVSNSPYMGARDYLGAYGTYFQHDDFDDLKRKMKELWDDTPKFDVDLARTYLEFFSYDEMARKIYEAICGLKKN